MARVINVQDLTMRIGARQLVAHAGFRVDKGMRIGLVGRNGAGKTTMTKLLAAASVAQGAGRAVNDADERHGLEAVEHEGTITCTSSVGYLPQDTKVGDLSEIARDRILSARGIDALLARIRKAEERIAVTEGEAQAKALDRYTRLDHEFTMAGGYAAASEAARIAAALGLPDRVLDQEIGTLSGGQRRRVELARVLFQRPDTLLLDEPTNHLDIEAIEALEAVVNAGPAAIIITHDRRFLDQVATRIIELDRGLVRSFPGNFATYEKVRGEQLEAEAVANRKFDKFWAQEEVWIRKGIEARRTRNEGRVRRLEALREARAARRERTGQIRLEVDAGERSGKLVCETRQAGISLGGRCLVRDLDLTIMRGDRIGLIGPNGIGKSTLLKLILGEYPPDTGSVRLGSNLQIAYFDQLREQLDPEQSVANTVSPGSEYVEINGARRHIMSYLQDFLFPSNRANSPVRTLSGGERNRLLLARLFARPANLLVLDEPTNDLDLESIDLLESMLQSYPGTLLLVSHDRRFLDNVVTSVLVAQGDGHWLELVGGYSDWLAWRQTQPNQAPSGFGAAVIASSSGQAGAEGSDTANRAASASGAQAADAAGASSASAGASVEAAKPRGGRLTLSNREVRDLANLPGEIETLEAEIAADQARMNEPDFFRQPPEQIKDFQTALADKEQKVLDMMTRWEELLEKEAQVNASRGR